MRDLTHSLIAKLSSDNEHFSINKLALTSGEEENTRSAIKQMTVF